MRRITDAVRADPVVEEVYRAKSEELGPGTYRFVAEIEFSGSKVVERYLDQGDGAKREQLHGMLFLFVFVFCICICICICIFTFNGQFV